MSKVLVDRELLDQLQEKLDPHRDAVLWGEVCDAIRRAQPAEAEGVRDYLAEFAEGEVEAKTAIEELQDALSAVTAERDRLREELERNQLWHKRTTDAGAICMRERDQLRAEVEELRPIHAMILNALDRDAEEGKTARGEMAAELRAAMAAKEA